MKNGLRTITTALLVLFVLTGCGTIFKGSSADVKVNSTPAGASVWIDGINKGTTPQTLSLKRDKNYVLEFRKDGYENVRIAVNKKFDIGTSVVGNIFSWGIVGILVDLGTGAAYSLEPYDLQANLAELEAAGFIPKSEKVKEGEVHVFMITKEEWAKISSK
ncbi:PEGA domain-containing protein [Gracilimonas tropica]|uniref:PEGA domain-containing protein n=1 Tax=Gracilimonas tropica TaxID=454600 RepID=UPI0003747783|nr:PEGA domain-containing protein [Gracilimonas tropica]